jgi:transcriptional regulator with XRE-family HTH domain
MKHQNKFGAAFRTVRLARGLTQEDFANESGRTYISELERGLKQPTLQKIDNLAIPLGLHPLTALFLAYLTTYDVLSADRALAQVRDELHGLLQSIPSK